MKRESSQREKTCISKDRLCMHTERRERESEIDSANTIEKR